MKRRLLVVDDDPISLKLACRLLRHEGYDVIEAIDGAAALERVHADPPCLMLVDLQLPGMDGLELVRRVKADPRTQHIPIVAVTAHAMKGTEAAVIAAGCDAFVTKPFDTRDFSRLIGAFVERQA